MNTSNIKKYAPQARNDFIAAMRKQAAKYGITADRILPAEQKGDLLLIGETVFPLSVLKPRDKLIKRIQTSILSRRLIISLIAGLTVSVRFATWNAKAYWIMVAVYSVVQMAVPACHRFWKNV